MSQICQFYIVVAVLNARESLELCLDSALRQDYPNKKLIVVDGGSDDGTVDIIKKYQTDLAWWISEPDQGIYDAWNKALDQIEDGWVLFLGADDIMQTPDVLTLAAETLRFAGPEIKIAYGQVAVVDEQGRTLAIKGEPWSAAGKNFTETMTLPHQGVFHHSTLFLEFGGFNPEMKIAGDYELLLRVLHNYPPLFLEDLVVASWKIGGVSYNVKTALLVAREFSKARRLNDLNYFSINLSVFYLKAYVLRFMYIVFGFKFTSWFAGIYRKFTRQWS